MGSGTHRLPLRAGIQHVAERHRDVCLFRHVHKLFRRLRQTWPSGQHTALAKRCGHRPRGGSHDGVHSRVRCRCGIHHPAVHPPGLRRGTAPRMFPSGQRRSLRVLFSAPRLHHPCGVSHHNAAAQEAAPRMVDSGRQRPLRHHDTHVRTVRLLQSALLHPHHKAPHP